MGRRTNHSVHDLLHDLFLNHNLFLNVDDDNCYHNHNDYDKDQDAVRALGLREGVFGSLGSGALARSYLLLIGTASDESGDQKQD